MKKTNKIILKWLNIALLLFLSSCEKDLYEDAIEQSNVKQVKLSDLPFLQNYIKQQKELNESNKTVTDYLSLINPDNIIMITDSLNRKSYTFSLKLEEENDKLTNLLIQESGTDLEYYLIKYSNPNLEQWKIDLENHQVSSVEPNVLYESLTDTNRVGCETSVVVYQCPSGMHDSNTRDLCNFDFSLWHLNVAFSDVPCGGDVYATSIPNLGGGGSSIANPCNNLKKKLNPTEANLKPTIVAMKATLNQPGENIAPLIKDAATNTYFPPVLLPPTTTLHQTLQTASQIYGDIHTHPYRGTPMFSFEDIYGLYEIFQGTANANLPELTRILVVEYSPGVYETYALTIDDQDAFLDTLNNEIISVADATDNEDAIYKIDLILGKDYEKNTNYEKTFLQRFANFGISLFKANQSLTKWDKLYLDNNNNVKKQPCN